MNVPRINAPCPACGQQIALQAMDLSASVTCPRCRASHLVGALIPVDTPLPPLSSEAVGGGARDDVAGVAPPVANARVPTRGTSAFTTAGTAFVRFSRAAVRFDFAAARWRGPVLVGGAAATNAALLWCPAAYAWVLPGYALVCWAFVVARIWALRDDDGRWSTRVLLLRIGEAVRSVVNAGRGLLEGAWTEGLRRLGLWLMACGIVVMTVARPTEVVLAAMSSTVAAIAPLTSAAATTFAWSAASAGVGAASWVLGWAIQWRSAAAFTARGPVSLHGLPAYADLRLGVPPETPPQLRELFTAIGAWKPRVPRGAAEKVVEAELVRHLRRRFPLVEVAQQRPVVDDDGKLYRLDVTFQRSIALELKVTERLAEVDRAVGQVERYATCWPGPVLVVHCGASDAFLRTFAARFQRMREQGLNVAVVAAGRRV